MTEATKEAVKSPILKKFQEIMEFLKRPENLKKQVSEVIDQVTQLASAKTRSAEYGSVFLKDNKDVIVAIKCAFFQRWMPLVGATVDDETVKFGDAGSKVDFGDKVGTGTGLNSMCKVGQNAERQRKRDHETGQKALMNGLLDQSIDAVAGQKQRAKLETALTTPGTTKAGFATRDEVVAYLTKEQGVTVRMPV